MERKVLTTGRPLPVQELRDYMGWHALLELDGHPLDAERLVNKQLDAYLQAFETVYRFIFTTGAFPEDLYQEALQVVEQCPDLLQIASQIIDQSAAELSP